MRKVAPSDCRNRDNLGAHEPGTCSPCHHAGRVPGGTGVTVRESIHVAGGGLEQSRRMFDNVSYVKYLCVSTGS
jgi:hypothetical protein